MSAMSYGRILQGARKMTAGSFGGQARSATPCKCVERLAPRRGCVARIVVGIDFVTCDTASGGDVFTDQVFPTNDGVVEFWREAGGEPRNWRTTPKCGEARFAETEYTNTETASANGQLAGRGMLAEVGSGPVIYNQRQPGTTGRVWVFNPVAGTHSAVTSAFTFNGASYDTAVRGYASRGYLLHFHSVQAEYRIRSWVRASEATTHATSLFWTFDATGQAPENLDIEEDPTDPNGIVWAAGSDGAGSPYVMRLDGDLPTWALNELPGYTYDYVDTIQVVGTGQALGTARNLSSTGDADLISIFRFQVGATVGAEITDACTVDGIPYRTWAAAQADNIGVQSGYKLAVLGERVAARTENGSVLLGVLRREC